MMDAKTAAKPAAGKSTGLKAVKFAYGSKEGSPPVPGRREWFKYADLGVTKATDGQIRAQTMETSQGLSEPTGWHYHTCEAQFAYVLKGWVDLEFENGQKIRVKEGESLLIPGGMRHNETATSNELKILELSLPSDMGTVPCEAPEHMR